MERLQARFTVVWRHVLNITSDIRCLSLDGKKSCRLFIFDDHLSHVGIWILNIILIKNCDAVSSKLFVHTFDFRIYFDRNLFVKLAARSAGNQTNSKESSKTAFSRKINIHSQDLRCNLRNRFGYPPFLDECQQASNENNVLTLNY